MRARITYLSDQAADYVEALGKVRTLAELWHLLEDYKKLFPDAYEARPLDVKQFKAWRKGLISERRGNFAGMEYLERYGKVMLPDVMMHVGAIANHFRVPWGCAYLRMKDVGRIVERDGVSYHVMPKQETVQ
jgi:hypothetical protein